jgi:hypothetical protein
VKLLWALAIISFGTPGMFFAWLAIKESRYLYYDNGRYFDGIVVHHLDAVLAYGLLAALLVFLALLCVFFLIKRIVRDRKN